MLPVNKPNYRLVIRSDASSEIGIGHVMRDIALGQYWQREFGDVYFLCQHLPESLSRRLISEGFSVTRMTDSKDHIQDAQLTRDFARSMDAAAIVLDGYNFDDPYQSVAFSDTTVNLVFDDYGHATHTAADCIINLNLGADPRLYDASSAVLLLGPDYAMIRNEFLVEQPQAKAVRDRAQRILVTFGGSDPANATTWVATSLGELLISETWDIRLLVGPGFPFRDLLTQATIGKKCFSLLEPVDNLCDLYSWCDIAICAGGGSNWEMSLYGVPRIVVPIAQNQVPGTIAMEMAGCCWHVQLEDTDTLVDKVQQLMLSSADRIHMMLASQKMVDGRGSQRTAETLIRLIKLKASHGSSSI